MSARIYSVTVTNQNTGESIILTARDEHVLNNKVIRQHALWEKQAHLATVEQLNADLLDKKQQLRKLLKDTLLVDDTLDWDQLVDNREYPDPPTADSFRAKGLTQALGFMLKAKAQKERDEADKRYNKALSEYEKNKHEFLKTQSNYNRSLAGMRKEYENGTAKGVEGYIKTVLNKSTYPDFLDTDYEIAYEKNSQTLVVKVVLPREEQLPREDSYKFVSARSEVVSKPMSQKAVAEQFNNVQYQIIIRTLHEVFESDYKKCISNAVINGYVVGLNKGNGQEEEKCIMTLQAAPDDLSQINLENVDPEYCFKELRGVTAGALIALSPVRPIMTLDKNDKRLLKAEELIGEFSAGKNLAIMDWQEFEVLIRDLFNREFSTETCTVEVTQASRDAGVDAIAFDEDPIRGGKIVIQAKRYNNLVPLTAVRDLYGTVQAENALKGILVTTSYYGPDAIKFCKDKPLTLINGEQLLFLFQKHGYDFKIELTKKRAASRRMV